MSAAADIIRVPKPRASWNVAAMLVGLCFVLACAAPFGLNGYGLYLLTLTEIFALVALGLNLLTGYAGQISLCHASLFGVGAYATAILTQKAGLPYLLALLVGALLTTAIGALAACRRFASRISIWPSRRSASASCCRRSSSSGEA